MSHRESLAKSTNKSSPNRWITIAPILSAWVWESPTSAGFDFGNGVRLIPMPDWARSSSLTPLLSARLQSFLAKEARYALTLEYSADSLGPSQVAARKRIAYTNQALWIAGIEDFGYEIMLDCEQLGDRWLMRHVGTYRNVRSVKPPGATPATMAQVQLANALVARAEAAAPDSSLGLAMGVLWHALTTDHGPERLLNIWIALEALFGPDGAELVFRISLRIALFLAGTPSEAHSIYADMKSAYKSRSKLVHGSWNKVKDGDKLTHLATIELAIRRSLQRILADDRLATTFSSKTREDFLEALPFRDWPKGDSSSSK